MVELFFVAVKFFRYLFEILRMTNVSCCIKNPDEVESVRQNHKQYSEKLSLIREQNS